MWPQIKAQFLDILNGVVVEDGISWGKFYAAIGIFVVFMLAKSISKMVANFFSIQGMVRARRAFAEDVHSKYMAEETKCYFTLSQLDTSLDNVDQRLSSDMDWMFQYGVEFFLGGVMKPESGFISNVLSGLFATYSILYGMPWDKEKKNGELWSSVLLIYGIYFGLLAPILWLSNVVGGKQQEQQKNGSEFPCCSQSHKAQCRQHQFLRRRSKGAGHS
jgi:hypothetical protein